MRRWIGAPGMAALFALPLMWTASPTAHGHPVTQPPVPRTILGSWSILFGRFDFVRTGTPGTYTDHVIAKRLGVFCAKVNDRNGQIVLHRDNRRNQNDWTEYTGTWQWFQPSTCKFVGYGRVTVTLWRARPYAYFTAYPPVGIRGASDTMRIERVP
jgi:hypothetical protein